MDDWNPSQELSDTPPAASPTSSGLTPPGQYNVEDHLVSKPSDIPEGGFTEALTSGAARGLATVTSLGDVANRQRPDLYPNRSPEAQPYKAKDVFNPRLLAKKFVYSTAEGAPGLALGIGGAVAGTAAGALIGPEGAVPGGVAGMAMGAGAGAFIQSIAPFAAEEAANTPDDLNAAYDRAYARAARAGAFGALSGAAFGIGPQKELIKQLLFQGLLAQPAVAVAQNAAENSANGRPVAEGAVDAAFGAGLNAVIPTAGIHYAKAGVTALKGDPSRGTGPGGEITPEDMGGGRPGSGGGRIDPTFNPEDFLSERPPPDARDRADLGMRTTIEDPVKTGEFKDINQPGWNSRPGPTRERAGYTDAEFTVSAANGPEGVRQGVQDAYEKMQARLVRPAEVKALPPPEATPAVNDSEGIPSRAPGPEILARPEVGEPAPAPESWFRTAKGSVYVEHGDGTTTRDKAFRPEHGAEDQGVKPRSSVTVYVTPQEANALGEVQARGGAARIIAPLGDGRYGVQYVDGQNAGKFERRTVVAPDTAPSVGLVPVEIWNDGKTASTHFGNEIVDVGRGGVPQALSSPAAPSTLEAPTKILTQKWKGTAPPENANLLDFVGHIGIKPNGDLKAMGMMDARGGFRPGYGMIVRRTGKDIDYVREAAAAHGYLPANSTPADLLNLLDRASRGEDIRPGGYKPDKSALQAERQEERGRAWAEQQVSDILTELNGDASDTAILEAATNLMVKDGLTAEEAIERAVMGSIARELSEEDKREITDASGIPFFDDNVSTVAVPESSAKGGNAGAGGDRTVPASGAQPGSKPAEDAGKAAGAQGPAENAAEQRQPEPEPAPGPIKIKLKDTDEATPPLASKPALTVPQRIRDHFIDGKGFANILQARRFVRETLPDATDKEVDELVEQGVVLVAREIAKVGASDTFAQLVDLYGRQPNLSTRTAKSVTEQAYSTPAPLAYVASRLADVANGRRIYEPSAGNGMLLIEADPGPQLVVAGEIDKSRQDALTAQGFTVSPVDATSIDHGKGPWADTVIMNPPFGAVREGGSSKSWTIDGWETTAIDHAIALNGLKAMGDDGRAVLILGGVKGDDVKARSEGYSSKAKREFYWRLYRDYNVTDHFTVDGSLYVKQGAAWPVDVVVINGRGKSERRLPAADVPPVLSRWEDVGAKAQTATEPRTGPTEPDRPALGDIVAPVAQPPSRDAGLREPPAAIRPLVGKGGSEPDQAGGLRAGAGDGQRDAAQPTDGRAQGTAAGGDSVGGRSGLAPPAGGQQPRLEEPSSGQSPYKPGATSNAIGTLVPSGMKQAIETAIGRVIEQRGDLVHFVASELGMGANSLPAAFSAEQIDALALGIHNIKNGSSLIVGDQTGIGKGRVMAGLIHWAGRNDMVPVFVTEKPDLFGDMFRDLTDIGVEKNVVMTNAGKSVPLDEEALAWQSEKDEAVAEGRPLPPRRGKFFTSGKGSKQEQAVRDLIAKSGKDDVIFSTYDQMNTVKGETTVRRALMKQIAPRAMFIFDEAHNAGGQVESDRKPKAGTPQTRAEFLREVITEAKAVVYSSATYAKNPSVMTLYSRTDITKAVKKIGDLPDLIAKGGVPLQQVVASMLAQGGQYIRRERSFAGVEYAIEGVPVSEQAYASFANAVRSVFEFDRKIEEARGEVMAEVLAEMGAGLGKDSGVGEASAHSTEFSSIMHNVIGQMLLSITSDAAADRAIAAHQAGEKPVLTLSSTMESFLQDHVEEKGIKVGEPVDLTFHDVLHRYLQRTLRVTIKSAEGEKTHYQIPLEKIEAAVPGASRLFAEAEQSIADPTLAALPVSPIDHIRMRLTKAGIRVAEITGRKLMVDYSGRVPVLAARPKKEIGSPGKINSKAAFQRGGATGLDALILNKSGSTGISLHAEKKSDQKKRRTIIVQADSNIDTFMQMLGRIHRTGQVVLPAYSQIVPEVPAAVRPAAILMKKMASLNANTTAARGSALSATDSTDFMNKYGDQVVARILGEDPMLNFALGEPIDFGSEGDQTMDAARKVTGRLVLLPPDQQQGLIDRITSEYSAHMARLDAAGANGLEAKTIDLQARTTDTKEVGAATGEAGNPFTAATVIEKMSVKSSGRAMKPEALAQAVVDGASSSAPPDMPPEQRLERAAADGKRWASNKADEARVAFSSWMKEELKPLTAEGRANKEKALTAGYKKFVETIHAVPPGAKLMVDLDGFEVLGVVTGVKNNGSTKNPVGLSSWEMTIAVPDGAIMFRIPFSQIEPSGARPGQTTVTPTLSSWQDVVQAFEEAGREGRENRVMLTGNILTGFDLARGKGQIINYTREDGSVSSGILLPRGTTIEGMASTVPVGFDTGAQVMQFIEQAGKKKPVAVKSRDGIMVGPTWVTIPAARGIGGKYYTERSVQSAAGVEFQRRGSNMVADKMPVSAVERTVDAMVKLGARFETLSEQDIARKIMGIGKGEPARKGNTNIAPGFYSAVGKAVLTSKMTKGSAEQWMGYVRKQPGVKEDEIKWIGLDDWLKKQPGAVTRDRVAEFIAANQITVGETIHGGDKAPDGTAYAIAEWYLEQHQVEDLGAELTDTIDRAVRGESEAISNLEGDGVPGDLLQPLYDSLGGGGATKFAGYQMPGGTNYREMLLTLPVRGLDELGFGADKRRELGELGTAGRDRNAAQQARFQQLDAELAAARQGAGGFRAGHWDEPNVVAHIRVNDRTDVAGHRTLFVEEIQSDWHQKGRKLGYHGDEASKIKAYQDWLNTEHLPQLSADELINEPDLTHAQRARLEYWNRLFSEGAKEEGGVPDAPFKTTWPELAMKRAIRLAAEKGYDQIAWTTGDIQAARYDLSKQVDWVEWNGQTLTAGKGDRGNPNTPNLIQREATAEQLADIVGKDAADKLIEKHKAGAAMAVLKGLDLKVGGAGMRGFYDKMLPTVAANLGKKFGAKVGKTTIDTAEGRQDAMGRPSSNYRPVKAEVHSLPITEAMRESVLREGQRLFQSDGLADSRPGPIKESPYFRVQPDGRAKLERDVRDIIERTVGKSVGVKVEDSIPLEAIGSEAGNLQGRAQSVGSELAPTVGGYYQPAGPTSRAVIAVALAPDFDDPLTSAGHEAWHHVEEAALTPNELRDLKGQERRMVEDLTAPEMGRTADDPFLQAQPDYELRAKAYQRFRRLREEGSPLLSKLHPAIRKAFDKIYLMLLKVRDYLFRRGIQSYEQIFETARQGGYRDRAEANSGPTGDEGGRPPSGPKANSLFTSNKDPERGFIRTVEDDLYTLGTRTQADRIQLEKRIEAMPERIRNARTQERFYHYIEDPRTVHLTAQEKADFDQHVQPLIDKAEELFNYLRSKGMTAAQLDLEHTSPNNAGLGYVHRMVKGHNPVFDRFQPAAEDNPVFGNRTLSKMTSSQKKRVMMAVTSNAGDRHVVSIRERGGIVVHDSGKSWQLRQTSAGIIEGSTFRELGKTWTVAQATTREIEANTDLEYYKNAVVNTAENLVRLTRAARNMDFLDALKTTPQFLSMAVRHDGNQPIQRGWRQVNIPQLSGWFMDPRLANALDDYYEGGKLIAGQGGDILRGINNIAVGSLFWTPVIHAMNVGTHWFVARGWDNVTPHGMRSVVVDSLRAIKSVITQDREYVDVLKHGGAMIEASVRGRTFYERMLRGMGEDIVRNWGKFEGLARRLGFGKDGVVGMGGVIDMVRAIYAGSSHALWSANDIFMMQRIFELERKGKSRLEAIRDAERDIPNYRIPSEVLGTRVISQIMQDTATTSFGRYAYGRLRSYGEMLADLIKGDGAIKFEAVGKMMALGVLVFVIHPLMTQLWQAVTGDKTAKANARGAATLPVAIIDALKGDKDFTQVVEGIVTPSPAFKEILQQFFNRDFFTGKALGEGPPVQNVLERAGHAADQIAVVPQIKDPGKAFTQQLGEGHSRPPSVFQRRQDQSARARAKREGIDQLPGVR